MRQPANINLHPAIPRVLCPNCGKQMRLETIVTELPNNRERVTFNCDCGFDFKRTRPATIEHTL